jgi:hypothetical protein
MVLLIWGGVLVLLGNSGFKLMEINCDVKLMEINFEIVFLCFVVMTILFVSNMVLYYTALRCYNSTYDTYKLAAYLTVFYEKRPSTEDKKEEKFYWEQAIFEIDTQGDNKKTARKNGFRKRNVEYFALTLVSTVFMLILVSVFIFSILSEGGTVQGVNIILLVIYVIYLGFSIYWLYKIPQYTFSKDSNAIRCHHLKRFVEYAIDIGYYDKKKIVDTFGEKFWIQVMDKT